VSGSEFVDKTVELCLIGLVAYFEAFCKDQFASVVNICPELLVLLKKNGHDVMIDAADLIAFEDMAYRALGPMVAEKYDFGSAKQINSHYQALLKITPFSKDESKQYDQILYQRNLLVHRGGTFDFRYAEQNQEGRNDPIKYRAYRDELDITEEDYFDAALLTADVATKTATVSQKAVADFVAENGVKLTEDQQEALQMLGLPYEIQKVAPRPRKAQRKQPKKKTDKL
jgi:hypothetical protein